MDTLKVALIRTPIIQPSHHVTSLRAVPSIGIAYISGALTAAGHRVTVVDAPGEALFRFHKIPGTNLVVNGLSADEIVARIPRDVDLVGVSVMHANEWVYDREIIQAINKKFPGVPVFLGGENATSSYRLILQDSEIQVAAVARGEADHTAPLLVSALAKGESLHSVPGVAFRGPGGEVLETKRAPNIRAVDQLSLPRWDGIPLDSYFNASTGISSHAERSLTMVATRGCPHACTFCTVPGMWNSKWVPRSPESVVDEIQGYQRRYAVTHIDFVDLTFATSRPWTEKFCDLMIQRKVGIRWSLPIGTRTESLDHAILKKMREAGCLRILFSPESGSKLTLRRIKKKLNINDMNNAISGSLEAGLTIKLATIFGFPGQTKREAFATLKFIFVAALKGVHDVVCLCFVPYPGTELFDQLVAEGKVIPGETPVRLNNDIKNMTSWSEYIPKWATKYISVFGMCLFYGTQFAVRPVRIARALHNVFVKRCPVTNFEAMLYCFFFRAVIHIDRPTQGEVIFDSSSSA